MNVTLVRRSACCDLGILKVGRGGGQWAQVGTSGGDRWQLGAVAKLRANALAGKSSSWKWVKVSRPSGGLLRWLGHSRRRRVVAYGMW